MNHLFYDFEIYNSPETEIPSDFLLGNNEKKLLVVIKTSDFTDKNQKLITNILAAVHYNFEADALCLLLPDDKLYGINKMLVREEVIDVLCFGLSLKDVGLSFEQHLYRPIMIGKNSFLAAHSLEQISTKQEYKKALWSALQQIFLKS